MRCTAAIGSKSIKAVLVQEISRYQINISDLKENVVKIKVLN